MSILKEKISSLLLRRSNQGMVYFGHGICESKTDPYIEKLHLNKDDLISVIKFWKRIGVKFISMKELTVLSQNKFRHRGPWIHFTFDDGYRNNLVHLLPVMEKFHIPFTVFITTNFIGKNEFLPSTSIRIAILHTNKEITIEGYQLNKTTTREERIKIADALTAKYKYSPVSEGRTLLTAIQSLLYQEEWANYKIQYENDLPMSYEELRKIASSQLCHIAAHTHTHTILHANQSDEIIHEELCKPIQKLKAYTNYDIDSLAFPNGTPQDFTPKVISEAQKAGYQTIFTTIQGLVNAKTDALSIPRYILTSKAGWVVKAWLNATLGKGQLV